MKKLFSSSTTRLLVWSATIGGVIITLTLMMLALAGFFKPKVSTEPVSTVESQTVDPDAEIGEVQAISLPRTETAVGTVRAVHEASVASKILARVVEVNVKAGQQVSQGDVLVRLDDADLHARLKQAQSAHAAAQANLDQATLEHDRATNLIERNAISRSQFDQAVARLRTAQAELQRSEQAVEEAKVLLEFATIRAPMSGVVIDKRIEPGDTASPGQVLVTLYEPNRMQMIVTVRESLALRLNLGDEIPARLDALDHECLATVSEIVPQAEAASRSFTVKVTGPCPPGAYSGMFGRISIPLDDEEVLVVPASAVFRVGQLDLVEVAENGRTSRRTVQLGRRIDDRYEVLSGISAGEKVVLRAQERDGR